MSISTTPAGSLTNTASQTNSVASLEKTLGKDEFLKLFTSQLRFQDPLNPMESAEFTAQLAQFSSLEQLFNMNKNLQQLLAYQSSLNNGMVTGFIGKNVKTEDGVFGKVTGISFKDGISYLNLDNGQSLTVGQIAEIYEKN